MASSHGVLWRRRSPRGRVGPCCVRHSLVLCGRGVRVEDGGANERADHRGDVDARRGGGNGGIETNKIC